MACVPAAGFRGPVWIASRSSACSICCRCPARRFTTVTIQKVCDQALAELDVFKRLRHRLGHRRELPRHALLSRTRRRPETIAALPRLSREISSAPPACRSAINVLRSDGEGGHCGAAASGRPTFASTSTWAPSSRTRASMPGVQPVVGAAAAALKVAGADLRGRRRQARGAARAAGASTSRRATSPSAGLADAVIVTGDRTGSRDQAWRTSMPSARRRSLRCSSAAERTPENIERVLPKVNGLIVGSYFRKRWRRP